MGLKEIQNVIIKEAQAEADRLAGETRKEAALIVSEARKKAEEDEKRSAGELALDLEALEKRELASTEFAARKRVMRRKKELLDEFFSSCMKDLAALPAEERKRHVRTLVGRAMKEFQVTTVYTSKKDAVSIPGVNCLPADILGGAIIENSDGTQRIDLSYAALLGEIRTGLLARIAGELFGGRDV